MNPSYGGPCEGVRNFVPELSKYGIEHEVVCLDNPNSSYLGKDSFMIHPIGESTGAWRYNKNLIPWLKKNIEAYDFLIVHALWSYHGYAVHKVISDFKKKKGKNAKPFYFVMAHGMLDPYFQNANGRKLKAIRNWVYWKLIENKVVNDAEGILFTCELEQELARVPFKPYHPKKEFNVGYGINQPPLFEPLFSIQFNKSLKYRVNTRPYFLFLSRINYKKGIDLLVNAYLRILNSNEFDNVPDLIIAGPGIDSEFGKGILAMVKENEKFTNRVFFPGMLTGETKWGAFYGCEAFILPSHQENFGIAVVESLACAKPVLITDQINIYKEIQGANAGIVEPDTEAGVYKLLYKWLKLNDNEKKEMAENAKSCYQKYFNIEVTAQNLKRAYETILMS
jgi:glycosyltransferase involved in cell wall biosynthesis